MLRKAAFLLAAAACTTLAVAHPTLIFTDARLANVTAYMKTDPVAQTMYEAVKAHADSIVPLPPVARPPSSYSGILSAAREVLDRLYSLTLVARLSGEQVYVDRAVEEMLNCTAWSDWNPSTHFLDTAELMHGVGAAYDGLYNSIAPANRSRIADGLADKGLAAFTKYHASAWWWQTPYNWGGVCNGGAIVAALALADDAQHGTAAASVLAEALEGIPHSMTGYAPDGMWPEGPIYEDYMTRYVIAAITALQGAGKTGNASSLMASTGFNATCLFTIFEQGAGSQQFFDWSDSDPPQRPHPNLLWLASAFNQPACAAMGRLQAGTEALRVLQQLQSASGAASRAQHKQFQARLGTSVNAVARNLLYYTPMGSLDDVASLPRNVVYRSSTDVESGAPSLVALFHASMNFSNFAHEDAHFLGFKAGANGVNHGHLDAGSFVYDYSALRFVTDLGSGWYGLPDYFGHKRWSYYRTNTTGHNVLRIGGQNQVVPSTSVIVASATESSDPLAKAGPWAVADLSAAYKPLTASRGAALLGGSQALIVDNLSGGTASADEELVWQLHVSVPTVDGPLTSPSGDIYYKLQGTIGSDRVVTTYLRVLGDATKCPGLQGRPAFVPQPASPQKPIEHVLRVEIAAPSAAACSRLAVTLGPAPPTAQLNVNSDLAEWPKSGPLAQ